MTTEVPNSRPSRSIWRRWLCLVFGAGVLTAFWLWPRSTCVLLSDRSTLVVDRVTIGPSHVSTVPFTLENVHAVWESGSWSWPRNSHTDKPGSIGVWRHSTPQPEFFADRLYLVDRDGWWWETTLGPIPKGKRHLDLFPPIEFSGAARFEVERDSTVIGSGVLPTLPPPPAVVDRRPASSFPIRWTRGPLSVVLHGVDVTTREEERPSLADVQLRIETFLHGEPINRKLTDLLVEDSFGRRDFCYLDEDARFTTELSPYRVNWHLRFLAWRGVFDSLEPEETFLFDPPPAAARGPQVHDREVAGTDWRFVIVPPETQYRYVARYTGGNPYDLKTGSEPYLICEIQPEKAAAVRVEFRTPDGDLIRHAVVDKHPEVVSRRLGVPCLPLDPEKPYQIRIGIHAPGEVDLIVRPQVLGKAPPDAPLPRPRPEPKFPSSFHG